MGESRRATPVDRDIQQAIIALKKGAHLLKYGRRGKPRFCPFRLSKDERSLIWFSGKEEKQLRLNAVSKIIAGQRTSNFHRQPRPEKEYQSFSLIYGNGEQSLDLICKDKEQAEIWFVGLKALISGTQSHKLYTDSWSDGGLQSISSSPAGHTRRKQPFSSVEDIEKSSHSGSNVDNLKQQCESKDARVEQYECEIQEAQALAREETTRCKAAKEVIRVLTGQLKDMAEKLPTKTQTSNMGTFLSPHLNALHELLSPTYPGLTEVPETEDIKLYDHKFYLSPTRVLRDIRVNGSCSPPVMHDTPTSALGRAFGYQNSARSTEGPWHTGSKIKENSGKVCKAENGHPPYTEWVEQDEPGVYFTFMSLADGQKDLKRVRFSRKRFSEREAEEWWAENRLRIFEKYNVEGISGQQ